MAVPHQAQIRDQNYLNWVKAGLSLKYTKEGIESFIDDETKEFHSSVLLRLGQKPQNCGQCTTDNLLPHQQSACPGQRQSCICSRNTHNRRICPNNVCGTLFNATVAAHRFSGPAWKNSHISQWVTDYWEIGKNYLPNTGGYLNVTSAKDTDLSGLVNIGVNLVNITKRHNFTRTKIDGAPDDFCQCRSARNEILHNASQSLTDDELSDYLSIMRATLQCTAALCSDTSAQRSLSKLSQLETSAFEITDENISEVRQMTELAIKNEGIKQVETVKDEGERQRNSVQSEGSGQVRTIRDEGEKQRNSMQSVGSSQVDALRDEGDMQRGSVQSVGRGQIDAIEGESKKQKQYLARSGVQAKKRTLLSMREEGKRQRKMMKTEGENTRRIAVETIQSSGNQQVETVKGEGDIQIQKIQQAATTHIDAIYQEKRNKLKHNMIENYIAQLQPDTLPEVDRLYVDPSMQLITDGTRNTDDSADSKKVNERYFEMDRSLQIRDVFFQDQTKFNRIYISGDAGHGKTALCKMLVLAWCQVHSGKEINKYIPGDFLTAMNNFEFLFYITLRNVRSKWIISEMIKDIYFDDEEFIFIKNEFNKSSCLVILDGLDEWVLPPEYETSMHTTHGLPDLRRVQRITILTTTRPWKMEVMRLEPPQIDRHVRLKGISRCSSNVYMWKMVNLLNQKKNVSKKSFVFCGHLAYKHLTHLVSIPILLKQLIMLWHHDENEITGRSQVQLYIAMINHLLKDVWERNKNESLPGGNRKESELPPCFREKQYCKIYKDLLVSLAHLAFTSTFKGYLIFDHVEARHCNLTEDDIKSCLTAGLLCQEIYASPRDNEKKKLSFLHKSFQEFLAAVYLVMNPESAELFETCKTFESILDMRSLLIFVCGMDYKITSLLSQQILNMINEFVKQCSPELNVYRLLQIQDLMCECIKERGDDELLLPHLERVVVCNRFRDWQIIQHLISISKPSIKYVYIIDILQDSLEGFLTCVRLVSECRSVKHVYLDLHKRLPRDTEALLEKALCDHWTLSSLIHYWQQYEPFSKYLYSGEITTLVRLEFHSMDSSIRSENYRIVACVEKATQLKMLTLSGLRNLEFDKEHHLDLSQCSLLQKLIIIYGYVTKVTINTAALKFCEVRCRAVYFVPHPGAGTTLLQTLHLTEVKDPHSLDRLATILPHLTQLSYLKLEEVDFGERFVSLSPEAAHIKYVKLRNVMMEKTAMIRFLTNVPATCRKVSLEFDNEITRLSLEKICSILPHLTRVSHLNMNSLDFVNRNVRLPHEATHLENVKLDMVTMTNRTMIQFLDSILSLNHKVDCRIKGEVNKAVMAHIITRFMVTKRFIDMYGDPVLYFYNQPAAP